MGRIRLKMTLNGRKLFLIGQTCDMYIQKGKDERGLGCKGKLLIDEECSRRSRIKSVAPMPGMSCDRVRSDFSQIKEDELRRQSNLTHLSYSFFVSFLIKLM